jgi:mitochondrial Rho GTPase 1
MFLLIAPLNLVRWDTSSLPIYLKPSTRWASRGTDLHLAQKRLQDQDGALNAEELEELFSTSPGNPWVSQGFPETTLAADSGAVTLQGWLAQWRFEFVLSNLIGNLRFNSMTTLLDHKTTLAYLAYLGYSDEPRTGALQITRARKIDRRKGKVTRNVFLCYVCGAAGSGKTSLLRAFAGKPFRENYEPTSKVLSVVNSVDIDGSEKYLVVSHYVNSFRPSQMVPTAARIRLEI